MLRNKEVLLFSAVSAVIASITAILCLNLPDASGVIGFAGCAVVFILCMIFTLRRYRKIAELSDYLQKMTHTSKTFDIRENTEGELSVLKNEIYKVTNALTEQAGALHKDKLELANALSDISHQLKTPLTSLGIMADLLDDDNLPPEKKHEFIDSMNSSIDRMEWLILSLLKLARLDADAALLKKDAVCLSALVEKALAPMLIPMDVRNQTCSVCGEDMAITCDPEWTTEAVSNIIKNAVENTPEGSHIDISYGTNPLYAYIIIRDNGSGISRSDLPHLFKRFYRGQGASQSSTGLGLSLSLSIMQKQNGDIEVKNKNGSVFTLKFYYPATVTG